MCKEIKEESYRRSNSSTKILSRYKKNITLKQTPDSGCFLILWLPVVHKTNMAVVACSTHKSKSLRQTRRKIWRDSGRISGTLAYRVTVTSRSLSNLLWNRAQFQKHCSSNWMYVYKLCWQRHVQINGKLKIWSGDWVDGFRTDKCIYWTLLQPVPTLHTPVSHTV
jgi:hypothetical protein